MGGSERDSSAFPKQPTLGSTDASSIDAFLAYKGGSYPSGARDALMSLVTDGKGTVLGAAGTPGVSGPIKLPDGSDRAKLLSDYQAWKAQAAASDTQHAEYLAIAGASPGRQGTILTPTTPAVSASILGSASSLGKTVLG